MESFPEVLARVQYGPLRERVADRETPRFCATLSLMKVFALFFLLYWPATVAWAEQAGGTARPPDVFLVTIDTLRADHIHCYGYEKIETPALDSLAKDGVRFEEAFTASPITNSSHATILTGLLPSDHGVTDFGVPLAPDHPTWAELLKPQGYHTAAFIGAVILDSNQLAPGFDRGFDFYDNFPEHSYQQVALGSGGAAGHGSRAARRELARCSSVGIAFRLGAFV